MMPLLVLPPSLDRGEARTDVAEQKRREKKAGADGKAGLAAGGEGRGWGGEEGNGCQREG